MKRKCTICCNQKGLRGGVLLLLGFDSGSGGGAGGNSEG